MPLLQLITSPDPLLHKQSSAIKTITDEIKTLAENMLETMYFHKGIGLAAVQVGVLVRLIVVDILWPDDGIHKKNQYIMINPKIFEKSPQLNKYNEGCLSFPNESVEIIRPKAIDVEFLDLNGNMQKISADGLLATCIQHEIDHTNGITIEDGLSPLKKQMMRNRIKKLMKHNL